MVDLDKVAFSTLTDAYLNYNRQVGNIHFDADILPDTFSNAYSSEQLPFSRGNTRADVYLQNSSDTIKVPANTGNQAAVRVYQFATTERAITSVIYTPTYIQVTIEIENNTGSSITLTPQDIKVIVVLNEAPINNL